MKYLNLLNYGMETLIKTMSTGHIKYRYCLMGRTTATDEEVINIATEPIILQGLSSTQ